MKSKVKLLEKIVKNKPEKVVVKIVTFGCEFFELDKCKGEHCGSCDDDYITPLGIELASRNTDL